MTRSIARVNYLGEAGIVQSISQGAWDFLYRTSTVVDPKWNAGDRVVLPDGRVFRYGLATNIVSNTMQGLKFYGRVEDGIAYKTPTQSQAVGDTEITVDAGDSGDYTEDQLRGGYVIVHTHGDLQDFSRGIVGNSPSDADGNVTLYLDARLSVAITTAYGVETCPNPYAILQQRTAASGVDAADYYTSVAGLPMVKTTVANQYVWVQTWGPCWINPQGDIGYTPAVSRRTLFFTHEGSIIIKSAAAASTSLQQIAGFLITRETAGGTGPPLVMLQISV